MTSTTRTTALLAALAAGSTLLVACSGGAQSGSTASSKAASTTGSSQKVTITFMEAMAGKVQSKALEEITKRFEKAHPDIEVKLQKQPNYPTLRTKTKAETAAGKAPTIAQMYGDWASEYVKAGALEDLSARAKASSVYQGFRKGVKKDLVIDGKIFMMPFNKSVMVQYYNPTMVKKAPKTWAEFAATAKAVSKGNVVALAIDPGNATGPAGANSMFDALAETFGDPVFASDGTPQFTKPGVVKALTWLVDLKNNHALALGERYPGQQALANKVGAFDVSSVASLPYNRKAVGDKFTLGVAPLPVGPGGAVNQLAGTNIAMFASATKAQKDAAFKYMEFIASPEQQSYWAAQTNYLPVSKKAESLEPYASYEKKNPWAAGACDQLDTASALPPVSWLFAASVPLSNALRDAINNGVDPTAALTKAQNQAMAIMKQARQ